jgi:protein-L-isoaspartate O-methyltransferase
MWEATSDILATHEELVEVLKKTSVINSTRVESAMAAVDRGIFVPTSKRLPAYAVCHFSNSRVLKTQSFLLIH